MTINVRALADGLRSHPAFLSKLAVANAVRSLALTGEGAGKPGDDAAILERDGGYDLLAGEGFIPEFVARDPWFAGWCGVMVNLSDIAAMGGRAVALIDQVWAPDGGSAAQLLQGLKDAAGAYGVPIVGGHTNFSARGLTLAVSVFGRANRLITSFDARPGDCLIAAIDHRGTYRNFNNFCAALDAPHERLRGDLELLPHLAEQQLVRAGKDISQAGLVGTALMLAECSGVGLSLDLPAIGCPEGISLERWLVSFPSFGFLFSADPATVPEIKALFEERGISAERIGDVVQGSRITFKSGTAAVPFWDHACAPYLALSKSLSKKEPCNA